VNSITEFSFLRVRKPKSSCRIQRNQAGLFAEVPKENDNDLEIGKVLLTSTGKDIASICAPELINKFDEYVIAKWKEKGVEIIGPSLPTQSD
jgi:hypothetical protein